MSVTQLILLNLATVVFGCLFFFPSIRRILRLKVRRMEMENNPVMIMEHTPILSPSLPPRGNDIMAYASTPMKYMTNEEIETLADDMGRTPEIKKTIIQRLHMARGKALQDDYDAAVNSNGPAPDSYGAHVAQALAATKQSLQAQVLGMASSGVASAPEEGRRAHILEHMPDWAVCAEPQRFGHKLTPLGKLVIRMDHMLQREGIMFNAVSPLPPQVKMTYRGIAFVEGIEEITYEGKECVALVAVVKGKPMFLYDEAAMFPSDGLISKILTLAESIT